MEHTPLGFPYFILGYSIGRKSSIKYFLGKIIDKIDRKLNGWKYNQISKGDRLILINSSLKSTQNYLPSMFKDPISIYKQIEKLWRNFLWNGSGKSVKSHLINWDLCTAPKFHEGLRITKVKDTNFAVLNKWLWRFHHEENSMWKKIIEAEYSNKFAGSFPNDLQNSTARAPWRSILKVKAWFETKFK